MKHLINIFTFLSQKQFPEGILDLESVSFMEGNQVNIARGTTDPEYWFYNLNHLVLTEMNLKLF